MTVVWGAYEISGGTGMRCGIQIESQTTPVNASTTWSCVFTCWVQPGPDAPGTNGSAFNDAQTFNLGVTNGVLDDYAIDWQNTSSNLTIQHAGGQFVTLTYTYVAGQYGSSPGIIDILGTVSGVFNGITPDCITGVSVPARPWANAAAPTAATASRVSDTQASVAWTNHDSAPAAYGNIKLYRRDDAGGWALRATLAAGANSYSDTGIVANHKYGFAPNVLGANGVEIAGPYTNDIWTTPGAPSGLTATKLGNGNIRLDWANNVNYSEYTTRIEESQNGGAFSELTSVTGGTATYEHVAPSTSVTHTYRVRSRSNTGSLNSAYSASSNTIVLLATANPPTALVPSGAARDATAAIVFTWQHNPADGTPQSKYTLQYKIDAGSYVTVGPTTSSVSSYTLPAATLTNGHTITWHVATAGQNGTVGAYSADSSFVTSAKPTVNISAPAATINTSTATVVWTYFQEQSSAQATWAASLYDASMSLLEQISGTTQSQGTFTTSLQDATSYTVTVTATSAAGLASATDSQAFTVTYLPPAAVTITAVYDESSGSMVLTLVGDDPTGGVTVAISTVTVQRSINGGTWVTIVSELVLLDGDPLTAVVLDTAPTINGTNAYRAIVYSALPSSATSVQEIAVTAEGLWSFLSAGPGFEQIVRMQAAPSFNAEVSRARALKRFAGRPKPVQLEGEQQNLAVSVSGQLRGTSSTVEEYEAIAVVPGIVLWREPSGRRIFATLHRVATGRDNHRWADVAFDLTEIDYTE
jgi:hypothetical protein